MHFTKHRALIGGAKESVHEAEQCLAAAIVNGADTATKTLCAEVLAAAQHDILSELCATREQLPTPGALSVATHPPMTTRSHP